VLVIDGEVNFGRSISQSAGTPSWVLKGADSQNAVSSLNTFAAARVWDGTETAPTFTWTNGGRNTWTAIAFSTAKPTTGLQYAPMGSSLNLAIGTAGYPTSDNEAVNWGEAQQLDTYVFGSTATKWSQQIQKIYLNIGQLIGTTTSHSWRGSDSYSMWPNLSSFVHTHGGQVLISLRPQWSTVHSTQDSAFAATITDIETKISGSWKAVLWQECNQPPFAYGGSQHEFGSVAGYAGPNGSAADYIAYWQHYANIFRNHTSAPLVFDPEVASGSNNGGSGNQAGAVAYCPPDHMTGGNYVGPDEIYVDYYSSSFIANQKLDSISALANTAGHSGASIPFGLGEWGLAASGNTPNTAQWDDVASPGGRSSSSYIGYLINLFSARQAASFPNGWLIYFAYNGASGGLGGGNLNGNGILAPANNPLGSVPDSKIAGITALRTAVGS
jgi:hypothetical protein